MAKWNRAEGLFPACSIPGVHYSAMHDVSTWHGHIFHRKIYSERHQIALASEMNAEI